MAVASDKVSVIVLLLDDDEEEERAYKISKRSIWTRPWLLRRKTDGAFHTLFKELKAEHSEGFKGYVKMDVLHFDELSLLLQKHDTNTRECIKPEEMCCLALRYLTSGESFRSLEYQFRISKKAISYIIQEFCLAIAETVGKEDF